jgi:hypothetical protein
MRETARPRKPPPKADRLGENLSPAKPAVDAPTKTPVEVLIELGRELHGEHWIGPTARDLEINHRTLAAFVSGKSRLREGPILDALRFLVKSHTQAVARARELAKPPPDRGAPVK